MQNEFGVLTLATQKDYHKAIGLSLTLKKYDPGVPTAIVCAKHLFEFVEPFFTYLIEERADLRGFEHKIYLDEYSPFEKTFFFDSDILLLKSIKPYQALWAGSGYAVRGYYDDKGISTFGLDRKRAVEVLNKDKLCIIDGAGHAYFEAPDCAGVFSESRNIAASYEEFGAPRFADEDVVGIAMTKLDVPVKDNDGFLGSPWCALKGTFRIDTRSDMCVYEDALAGTVRPTAVHFPRFIFPFIYARELSKVFDANDYKFKGLYFIALKEFYCTSLKWPLMKRLSKLYKLLRFK